MANGNIIDLSVVIPTYNGRAKGLLEPCLSTLGRAIEHAGWTGRTEIVVIDDHSGDDTLAWLAANYPHVRAVRNAENRGFAYSANQGLARACGRWIGLLNNDVLVDERWLAEASKHFGDDGVGCVATRIMKHDRPGEVESAGDEYAVVGIPYQFGLARPAEAPEVLRPRRCFSGCGASVFYRRQALEQVGACFYEALGAYYEDVELGFRLNLAGWDTVYEPGSAVVHLGSRSYGEASFRKKLYSARNAEIVFWTCMPWGLLIRHLGPHLLAALLHMGLHLVRGTLIPYCCGKFSFFLFHLPATFRRRRAVQRLRTAAVREVRGKLTKRWFTVLVGAKLRRHAHRRNDRGRYR